MKKFYFQGCLLLLSLWGYSQNADTFKAHDQTTTTNVPQAQWSTKGQTPVLNTVDHELVANRTKFSKTFLNTNQTKTTVQSSVPLHYLNKSGVWESIDYRLRESNNQIVYPAQRPFFESQAQQTVLNIDQQQIKIAAQSKFIFVSPNRAVLKSVNGASAKPVIETEHRLAFKNIANGVDKQITLYDQAFKYSYLIRDATFIPAQSSDLIVEETLTLPTGFSITAEYASTRIVVRNQKGEMGLVFEQPVVSDSKVLERNLRAQPYEATYQLIKVSENSFKIQMLIAGSWLQSNERVFPINIDPVVTLINNNVINSCFLPTYEQASLQVAVPAGETVLSTDISYDFVAVAGSAAWMSDQRSFVSGPNGQTPVVSGVGNAEGTYAYNITNSPIGNVLSTGQINYTFNFSRNWGGSGCNATYNFVNRREVAVTYGTILFGDGPLLINEYSASNRNFNDGFGRNEDWIELYNSSPDTYFNLAGYHLSNNINNPTKWQIQDGIVPPNSRVLVYCSSRDISSGLVLHAGFDLTQTDPDEIVLADPSGNILQSVDMFVTQTNHSYGRTTDGADTWSVFATPTPGQQNTNGFDNYTTKPTFSVPPGKYPAAITVALASAGANEQIRYTTNGATPTASSTLYTAPISVSQNTVIRARAFSTNSAILPGFIETNSYFINDNSTLPVVSLSGDANLMQLLNGSQIEPTGYFEYFKSDGTFIDETMGDFDKHGNDSWAYNQRGIDFIARDDHGYKRRLEYPFFNTTDRAKYRRLILKAAGSDNFPGQTGGAHLRDVFVQKVSELSGMDLDERRSSFVSLFVNGQYWGIYDLREKVDDNQYTDYYYGQDYKFRDSDQYIQYIKTWGSTEPEFGNQPAIDAWDNLMAYVQNNDMAVEANYNYVDSQLNINSLIDYFVLNSYMVNKDWLNWNTSWWRGLDPSGGALKWRYALWDCDGVLGHYINYTGIPDITANADPCQAESIEVGEGHAQTIEKLITQSPIVRQRYIARYADLLNTHLSCAEITQVFDSIVAVIAPEMPRHVQRWGGSVPTWQANVQAARDFLLTRCSQTINTGLVECYDVTGPFETVFEVVPANSGKIKMNSEWLLNYPFTAQVFGNLETLVKAEPLTGYAFSHWEVDGAVVMPDDQNPDIILQISQATTVTAHFTEVLNSEEAIYYWHFNTLNTPSDVVAIPADYSLIPGANPMMTYTGSGPRDIDSNNTGSILNGHFNTPSGKCARVRNPADGRSLVFNLPTTGYKDLKFAFAVQRTNEGQLTNLLSYSTDGSNYTNAGLSQNAFDLSTEFTLVQLDFSTITAANNNPDFKVRINFSGNTTGDNGNNRYDNITLKGVADVLAVKSAQAVQYQVFPNPVTDNVQIVSSVPMIELDLYDIVGKCILQQKVEQTLTETIRLDHLSAGVYLLTIKTPQGLISHKLVKQ